MFAASYLGLHSRCFFSTSPQWEVGTRVTLVPRSGRPEIPRCGEQKLSCSVECGRWKPNPLASLGGFGVDREIDLPALSPSIQLSITNRDLPYLIAGNENSRATSPHAKPHGRFREMVSQ